MITSSSWEAPFGPIHPTVATVAEYWFEDILPGWSESAVFVQPAGLLVGEAPGPGHNPRLPLWPHPPHMSGGRLHAITGIATGDYLTRLARVNLARQPVARWRLDAARDRALSIMSQRPPHVRVVAVGARARDAFDLPGWFEVTGDYVAIPHPSGRNLEYNDPATVAAARRAVRWAAGIEEM
jgi:hypothetical protein